jgi:hypothetical protein
MSFFLLLFNLLNVIFGYAVHKQPNYNDKHVILWWTTVYAKNSFENYTINYCGEDSPVCVMTHERKYLKETNTILFHAWDIEDWPFRNYEAKKNWVLFSQEPPDRYPGFNDPSIEAKFDFAMTFRLNSAFPVPFFSKDSVAVVMKPLDEITAPEGRSNTVPVVWIASNCHSKNGRPYLVKEMMNLGLKIDSYGKCMNNKASDPELEHKDIYTRTFDILKRYKFYLAFENTNCRDYVTEKLHNSLAAGAIPIVLGQKDYSKFLPTHDAAIHVDDFYSVQELVEYIKKVDSDDELYRKHHAYRTDHSLITPVFKKTWLEDFPLGDRHGFCKLCEYSVNQRNDKVQSDDDPQHEKLEGGLLNNGWCEPTGRMIWWLWPSIIKQWIKYLCVILAVLAFCLLLVRQRKNRKHSKLM